MNIIKIKISLMQYHEDLPFKILQLLKPSKDCPFVVWIGYNFILFFLSSGATFSHTTQTTHPFPTDLCCHIYHIPIYIGLFLDSSPLFHWSTVLALIAHFAKLELIVCLKTWLGEMPPFFYF